MREHDHNHQHSHLSQNRVLGAMAVTGVILAAEVIGGILTNSLALLSDAGHMLTDLLALGLSYFAISMARRPPTDEKTYGFHRMEILAALANGVTLVVICLLIFYEAFQRINNPPEIKTTGMLVIAVIGLVANLVSAALLSGHSGSLNVRGAFLHVIGDALSSVGIILGGLLILFTGWFWVDPLISAGIGVIIVFGAYHLVRESMDILLEATPGHIVLEEVRAALHALPGVLDVHDLHVWCLTPQICSLSSHLVITDVMTSRSDQTLREINELLAERFHIEHTTIQFECAHCDGGDPSGCSLGAR
ncbi:MAG: cation diffusion facilitator family transporter [Chloroflexota bacterium]|nr:cation diffusion facilitator family transporter [Chloroflexota bacterium]